MLQRRLLKTVVMEGQKKIVDFVSCFQQEHKI